MNTKQGKRIKLARLRDWHEPAVSHSTVMKNTQRIATKRIRVPHTGKCLMALMKQAFQTTKSEPSSSVLSDY